MKLTLLTTEGLGKREMKMSRFHLGGPGWKGQNLGYYPKARSSGERAGSLKHRGGVPMA